MEAELLSYRANPTNARFERLYRSATPWLRSTGIDVVRRYGSLSVSGALDDVLLEGAFALSTAARRFSYFCECGRVFVHARDLSAHARGEHRRRGAAGAVTLSTFARTSARLAMKRTARRLHRPEVPRAEMEILGEDPEERIVLELAIARFRERLSAGARAALELLLRSVAVDPGTLADLRTEVEILMSDRKTTTRRKRMSGEPTEPDWTALNVRTLRESAREVLGIETEHRTMRAAYADVLEKLTASGVDLGFTCHNCGSVVGGEMERCWACGLVFDDGVEEEEVVEAELIDRARRFGIAVAGLDRGALLERIEEVETRTRAARRSVDLLTLESKRLNEEITEAMPDGWSKRTDSRQYVAFFDSDHVRRIAVMHRGLKVHFSVDDGFLDGFPDLTFFDVDARRAKHYGRTNYEYAGDTAKYALDLCRRVMRRYP